jgi:hypothetical protein
MRQNTNHDEALIEEMVPICRSIPASARNRTMEILGGFRLAFVARSRGYAASGAIERGLGAI